MLLINCSSDNDENDVIDDIQTDEMYFPPINSDVWETISMNDLGWNTNNIQQLRDFLINSNTEAFLILYNGKIAFEEYFNGFTATQNHTWNSAGKTLTAAMVGIAEQEDFLNIDDTSQQYLGQHWSSLTDAQEQQIRVKNHLTMTTGLDYEVDNLFSTDPSDLIYRDNPNSFWYYHNAPYTLLQSIVSRAINRDFDNYFNEKLRSKIGMNGFWFQVGFNRLYISTARSMARFGLLNLNRGNWDGTQIINQNYVDAMTSTSQNLNEAYGYLWWLNGKESFKLPATTATFQGKLIPNAPDDLFAGLGKNDQKLYVAPSKKLVIVRFGDASGSPLLGPSGYDNELWEKLNLVIN